ncbi:MAG TPA: NUDIX hydrolase [Acidimicrobiales bacterium]|nr:NUDIX hydrolase [Acidimicrobiales bacterium]
MTPFRKLSERERFRGSLISVATATFAGPDGEFERDVVHHPGAVSVVPLLDDGTVILVRQYRAAIEADLLEIPAGKRDVDGEPPEETAARELVEEVGMKAGRLELLAEFYNSPGFCDEHSWVFLGRDLTECANDLQGIEEQHMTVERVALADVPAMVARGEITDAKTIIGLSLVLVRESGAATPDSRTSSEGGT